MGLSGAITGKLVLAKDVREVLFWVETAMSTRVSSTPPMPSSATKWSFRPSPRRTATKDHLPGRVVKDSATPEAKAFEDFCSPMSSQDLRKYALRSLALCSTSPPVHFPQSRPAVERDRLVLGTVVARLCYTMKGRGATIVETILTLPLVLPPTVLAFFSWCCSAETAPRRPPGQNGLPGSSFPGRLPSLLQR